MASLINIIIDADDRASHKFDQVSRNARRMQLIIAAITAGAAAFTPALLGGLGAISALFGTAGIAAAGFGAISGSTIMKTFEKANDLEEALLKVDAAMINNDAKGYAKAMAEVQAIWDSMHDSEKRAVLAINEFKSEWQDMQIQMSPVTLELITQSMYLMSNALTGIFPAMKNVGISFVGMIAHMNQAIESGRAQPFFEHMNTYAVPMFERVMISAGNILKGFGGLMVSFTPLGMAFGDGMVDMTDKFAKWAWGLQSSPAFQDFCDMVRTNTPIIFQTLGTIVDVIWQIIITLNPLTMKILLATDAFLKWAMESGALDKVLRILIGAVELFLDNADWLLPILASLYLGFKALAIIQTTAKYMGILYDAGTLLVKGLGKVINVVRSAALAQGTLNAVQLASPHFWLIAGIAALIAVGVLLWQNWDEIAKWGKWLWSETKKSWNGIKKDVGDSYNQMVADSKKWWSETKQKWNDTVETTKRKAIEMYNSAVSKYYDMKNTAKSKLTEMYNDASSKWSDIKSTVTNKAVEAYNNVSSNWNEMKNTMYSKASGMWDAAKSTGANILGGIKSGIANKGNMMWEFMNGLWQDIKKWGKTFYNSGKGLLWEFADGIWKGVQKAYDNLWEGMKYIRKLLPFSPAKEGPLSDLDKSGKAFFPTWYEAAMTQVGAMQKTVGNAFQGVANEANVALAGTGLEAFTGGATVVTVRHEVSVSGDLALDAQGVETMRNDIQQQVITQTGVKNYGLSKTSLRKI